MNWSYVAGFFDGEGTVGVYSHNSGRTRGQAVANFYQVRRPVLEEIRAFLLSHGIKSKLSPPRRVSALVISQHSVPAFLAAIMPYLVVKKVEARDVLRFKRLFPPQHQRKGD